MSLESTFKIVKLEDQIKTMQMQLSAQVNFIEQLAMALLDEQDVEDAERLLREAVGREGGEDDTWQPKAKSPTGPELIKKIAEVAEAAAFCAGEGATELAGQILSVLVAKPDLISRFMAEGSGMLIDGELNAEHGRLSFRTMAGHVGTPEELRASLAEKPRGKA